MGLPHLGDVMKDHRLVGQASGGHERHGFVFVSLRFDLPMDGAASLDEETAVGGGGHRWNLPRPVVLISPRGA